MKRRAGGPGEVERDEEKEDDEDGARGALGARLEAQDAGGHAVGADAGEDYHDVEVLPAISETRYERS